MFGAAVKVGGVPLPSHCAVHLDATQDAPVENGGGALAELLMLQARTAGVLARSSVARGCQRGAVV